MGHATVKRFDVRYCLVILLSLSLQACVSDVKPTTRSEEDLQPIRSIAILSTLSNQFTITAIGLTTDGDHGLRPLTWDPNEYVISRVQALLDQRYTIKPMENAEAFIENPQSIADNKFDIKKAMANIPPREDVDAYLVIVPTTVDFSIYIPGFGMSSSILGQGFVLKNHDGAFIRGPSTIYAMYVFYLVNAKTHDVIAMQSGHLPKRDGFTYMSPLKQTKDVYPVKFAAFTEADKQRLDSDFRELLDSSLAFSLQLIGLRR